MAFMRWGADQKLTDNYHFLIVNGAKVLKYGANNLISVILGYKLPKNDSYWRKDGG